MIHTLVVHLGKTLRLGRAELIDLGVSWISFSDVNPKRTQAIGAAVAHLEYDGLIAPSARWNCDNVILFVAHHQAQDSLVVRESIEVDWRGWLPQHRVES
ncbi:MAG: RES family NAD+ phosphorylase [Steroidobacteraceae bacterium]